MKIGGQTIQGVFEDFIVIERPDPNDPNKENLLQIPIRARALVDTTDFEELCPRPKPPGKRTRDGWVPNESDPSYKDQLGHWQKQQLGYLVVRSLEPSEIEWDQVKEDNPKTWHLWEDDMKAGGLTNMECQHIIALVLRVNSLDEQHMKQARESFVLGQEQAEEVSSGQNTEPGYSPSGEAVNG